ncbi:MULTISPECIES: LysR family transcriptional regulator [unclassified Caulobacter]|uniref:LysR family transcriptional regulator n=1 Tax=unclassified Caulobacter TaxID=2648921 RepID=UPI0006F2109A|nr:MULTISPECIES: LysR family transcriptional regulator [unclassified Caulobacter]KQV58832.1 LysR family transcriptional regulator [Caulobacter sp. Root342]KQV68658.1 LysR family transcriptional regulator [Caulobacter sp. Root343]
MSRAQLPLNALRAFEASARHLSFTRAAIELCVTQAAVSHQVKGLEARLGASLFRRLPRGLALTDEGLALLPSVRDSFDRLGDTLARFEGGRVLEVLSVGVVGTFAVGWLLPRLPAFREAHPFIDLRLFTNNNRTDLAGEGLDCAVRFGDGAWHGTEAAPLFEAPMSPLCSPAIAERLTEPAALLAETLLRSYRAADWPDWFAAAGLPPPPIRGPVFDSSWVMVEAAMQGIGVALAPPMMFARDLQQGRLVRPFPTQVSAGRYWLTWLKSKAPSPALRAFQAWLSSTSSE